MRRFIKTSKAHLDRAPRHACLRQDILESDTTPHGVAHCAVAPLSARYPRSEEPATVAGAFADGRDLGRVELRPQVVE